MCTEGRQRNTQTDRQTDRQRQTDTDTHTRNTRTPCTCFNVPLALAAASTRPHAPSAPPPPLPRYAQRLLQLAHECPAVPGVDDFVKAGAGSRMDGSWSRNPYIKLANAANGLSKLGITLGR